MKRVRDILLAIVAVMIVVACGESRHISDTHKQAEAVMQEHPDSALALLQTIKPDDITTDRGRAMHALLLSQAYDKNYIDLTVDSLITIAVDYFAPTNEHHYAMLAHYYHGRVLYNAKDYINATLAYERTKQYIDYVEDSKLKGLLYSQLGEIYYINMDYPKSIESYKTAYDYYEKGGFVAHRNFALYDLGGAYFSSADYPNSEKYLNQALENAIEANDLTLIEVSKKALLAVYVQTKRTDKAFDLFKELSLNDANVPESSSYLGIVAVMYAQMSNSEMSDRYMKKAWDISSSSNDSIPLFYRAASCDYSLGNINSAWLNNLKGYNQQSTLLRQTLQQPIVTVQRDYLNQKLEYTNLKNRQERTIVILIIALVTSIASILIYLLITRIKQRDKKIDEYMILIDEIQCTAQDANNKASTLLRELFQEKYAIINKISSSISGSIKSTISQKQIIADIESIFEALRKESYYQELESAVNRYRNNIMADLRAEVVLNEKEYRQMCFHFAGFSVNLISLLLNENASNIYKRRARVKEKIAQISTIKREKYLI